MKRRKLYRFYQMRVQGMGGAEWYAPGRPSAHSEKRQTYNHHILPAPHMDPNPHEAWRNRYGRQWGYYDAQSFVEDAIRDSEARARGEVDRKKMAEAAWRAHAEADRLRREASVKAAEAEKEKRYFLLYEKTKAELKDELMEVCRVISESNSAMSSGANAVKHMIKKALGPGAKNKSVKDSGQGKSAVRSDIKDIALEQCRVIAESNPTMGPAVNAIKHMIKKV